MTKPWFGEWSGSPVAGISSNTWYGEFSNGNARSRPRGDIFQVRLVRGGQ